MGRALFVVGFLQNKIMKHWSSIHRRIMVVVSVLAATCALAMPFMQDDLTRRQQQQKRQQQQQQNQRQGIRPENNAQPQDDKTKNKPKIEVKSQAVSADESPKR